MAIGFELSTGMKAVFDERLEEDEQTYLSAETSIKEIKERYGL